MRQPTLFDDDSLSPFKAVSPSVGALHAFGDSPGKTRLVCFSGGHSSALVAIEVFRRYGNDSLVLLNHDINPAKEDQDIKRFKCEVAEYCGVPVTYANAWDETVPEKILDQFEACIKEKAFHTPDHYPICTSRLKTRPFQKYLAEHHPEKDAVLYYGFSEDEGERIARRKRITTAMGFGMECPLAEWEPTILTTEEIGIEPPLTYSTWIHANCKGCLRAGEQHWYVVYCLYPEIWAQGKDAEIKIGHTILKGRTLESLEPKFEAMRLAGVEPTERIPSRRFWTRVKRLVGLEPLPGFDYLPCECST